ncbi:hypothetical protein ACFFMN_13515 [Planobispora siamensis]|uniref:Uncharacterized protein n=1 Tax=Planobispora siamensis TaxID=936338 RepID=A0A8J3S7B1_9ACTN|nr:hypothetical protein [Planobispora siamensis]GIH89621.1 hypothetical protein Psi01_02510 [Planobispora siamensis]
MAKWFRRRTSRSTGSTGRAGLLLRSVAGRLGRRGAERIAAAPAAEKVIEGLHRAASGLAEVTSEVSAYAGLLEEKTDALRDLVRDRRNPQVSTEFSTGTSRNSPATPKPRNHPISPHESA